MRYVVYLDVFILINLVMNFTILGLTAKLAQVGTKIWRLLLGSALGVVYSLVFFTSGLNEISNFGWKILFSFVMVASVFAPTTWKKLIRAVIYFYLVSFLAGGAALAISYFINFNELIENGIQLFGDFNLNWWVLLLTIIVLLGAGKAFLFLYNTKMREKHKLSLTINFGDRAVTLYGLLDTGNSLKEPLSSFPVIVAEYDSIKTLFSLELQSVFEQFKNIEDLDGILISANEELWLSKLRIIPYSSVGKTKGMMLGFKPDEVAIDCNDRVIKVKKVVIAVCNRRLSTEGEYCALLHPELVIAA